MTPARHHPVTNTLCLWGSHRSFPGRQPLSNHATTGPPFNILELNMDLEISSPLDCSIVDSGPCLFDTSVSSRVRNKYMKTINIEFDELSLKVKKVDVLFEDKRRPDNGLMRYTYDVSKLIAIGVSQLRVIL